MSDFDFDLYNIGDLVEYKSFDDNPRQKKTWKEGTVVAVDRNDESLPWGISVEVIDLADFDKYVTQWGWQSSDNVRKIFVIEEEEELMVGN